MDSGFRFTGFGTKRQVSARRVMRQMARVYGDRGSDRLRRKHLDYRREGDRVTLYEEVPMFLLSLVPGFAVMGRASMPIVSISADYSISDTRRNRKHFVGESSQPLLEASDAVEVKEHQWRLDDIEQAARDDYRALDVGRKFFSPGSFRG